MKILDREPALLIAALSALLSLLIGFGVPVSPVQFGLIMAAVSAVVGVLIRSQVTPSGDAG